MLRRKELARSAHACLHFVGDEKNIVFFAYLRYLCNKRFLLRYHSALALNKFQHYRAYAALRHNAFNTFDVAALYVFEPFGERKEIVMKYVLSRCGKRRHRPAVKRIDQRYNDVPSLAVFVETVFSRRLYGALVGFCARVREKCLLITRTQTQRFRQLYLRDSIKEIGSVIQQLRLLSDGSYPLLLAVPERIDAYPARHINVLFIVYIPRYGARTAYYRNAVTLIGICYILQVVFYYAIHDLLLISLVAE